jgi:hypothetical protein
MDPGRIVRMRGWTFERSNSIEQRGRLFLLIRQYSVPAQESARTDRPKDRDRFDCGTRFLAGMGGDAGKVVP